VKTSLVPAFFLSITLALAPGEALALIFSVAA
jgi:hypothetical protein